MEKQSSTKNGLESIGKLDVPRAPIEAMSPHRKSFSSAPTPMRVPVPGSPAVAAAHLLTRGNVAPAETRPSFLGYRLVAHIHE